MFKLRKSLKNSQLTVHIDSEKRSVDCRRVSFDTKYLGMGKCIDRRKNSRRQEDRFDHEEYDRICHERLGPGWL